MFVNYIHQNPVHHGFCQYMEEWTFSSYHAFLSAKQTQLRRKEVIEWFGGEDQFWLLHRNDLMPLQEDWEFM
ncbi:MAG: hypothetical protein IPJ74_24700 [Saprospiraceae bacterium]|nr:hypothetical protein [Saprospiraceae bacterium]